MSTWKLCFCSMMMAISLVACYNETTQFNLLESSSTNITFNNQIVESDTMNVLLFEYLYNGAGVGLGDFNNDGLTDIFFAGNMVSCRLYLNKGNFVFQDVTLPARIQTTSWCTGVSLVDINQDGNLDIYVCTVSPTKKMSSANLLFLNEGVNEKGIPTFSEVAEKVGLADLGYSTQAAFLDYDLDGDLDMYLLNNAIENFIRNTPIGQRTDGKGKSVDRLYRCEGVSRDGLPVYKDVSVAAGILPEGWGLGVVVNDINQDGYPDVYAANDFLSNDHLFINNQDGTFTNKIEHYLKHQEFNGMGVDMADINNDGLNDIIAVDMLPEDNLRKKTMFSNIGYDRFQRNRQKNYQPQYVRNVLQLNNGNGSFSDIGYLAGISETDWSWSALLADFDNDGYRDLLITNGYPKDVTDMDFVAYSHESSLFGTDDTRLKNAMKAVEKLEGVKKSNFLFKNNGDLTFSNKAKEWGLHQPSYTNGAAYADLDNDGDLDLVMNNINDEAFIYRNDIKKCEGCNANYLRIKLHGAINNTHGLGAKISLFYQGQHQYAEHQIQRGYKSSVEPFEHFGVGNARTIDSLVVIWPTGNKQVLKNILPNQVITLKEIEAGPLKLKRINTPDALLMEEVHHRLGIRFLQQETDYVDYKQSQRLLPQKYSQLGPAIAVGDLNGDSLDDFIVSGAAYQSSTVFIQDVNGKFKIQSLLNKVQEDLGLLLFDADNDRDLDLYCVSGSSEFGNDSLKYQDRFYRNVGDGTFFLDLKALPKIRSSGSCVTAADFDGDGDLDLFRGGRIVPGQYPTAPENYLLINKGDGNFVNATTPELGHIGMVTAALWTDFDNDQWLDLILVGEWMPITLFKNTKGALKKFMPTSKAMLNSVGWWNSITGGDFDKDGDIDYMAGNIGLNSSYKASEKEPVCIYAKDYDLNGSMDAILCKFIQGKEYVSAPRDALTEQIAGLKKMLPFYSTYGNKSFREIFPEEQTEDALIYKATCFASSYIENKGNGNFTIRPLSNAAQTSPLFGMLAGDFNFDGDLDLLAVGNSYSTETLTGYYDAGIGLFLQGDGQGNFEPLPVSKTGFFVDKDAKAFAELTQATGHRLLIATSNQDSIKAFQIDKHQYASSIKLADNDTYAIIEFKNGRRQKVEFYFSSGYLSQSTRRFFAPSGWKGITIFNNKFNSRKIMSSD